MQARKRWSPDQEVKWCSAACRKAKLRRVDLALEAAIVALLQSRDVGKSICPSEAARQVWSEEWRQLMEPARMAARRLVAKGQVEITQKSRVVNPSTARGPIRIRVKR